MDEKKFINVYAHLLIIEHLAVNKEKQTVLISEMLSEYEVSSDQIEATIEYYKQKPQQWVQIMEKVRERIRKMRAERNKQYKMPEK